MPQPFPPNRILPTALPVPANERRPPHEEIAFQLSCARVSSGRSAPRAELRTPTQRKSGRAVRARKGGGELALPGRPGPDRRAEELDRPDAVGLDDRRRSAVRTAERFSRPDRSRAPDRDSGPDRDRAPRDRGSRGRRADPHRAREIPEPVRGVSLARPARELQSAARKRSLLRTREALALTLAPPAAG